MKLKKKDAIIIFSLALFCFLIFSGFIFAQRDLEVPLPAIGGEPEITETPLLPNYIRYLFNFAIGIGGLVAFVIMILGGFRYLTSAGNPSIQRDSRDQIFSAFLGIALLLGSWVLLTTINPQLIIINPRKAVIQPYEGVGLPGVYLCKDSTSLVSTTDCRLYTRSTPTLGDFDNKAGYVRFINSDTFTYGAVLHDGDYYTGNCRAVVGDGQTLMGVSSITVFAQADGTKEYGDGATFYGDDDYTGWSKGPYSLVWPYKNWNNLIPPLDYPFGKSIKIENDNKYLVVLFQNPDQVGRCEVFTKSDSDLAENPIGICDIWSNKGCWGSVIILPINNIF